jgi:hypothetical protein
MLSSSIIPRPQYSPRPLLQAQTSSAANLNTNHQSAFLLCLACTVFAFPVTPSALYFSAREQCAKARLATGGATEQPPGSTAGTLDGRWPHRRAVIVAERGGCGPPQHGSASPAASWCQNVRMPTVPCSPPCPRLPSASACPASAPSGVRPSSVRRPVRMSSVRSSGVQCPVSACPVSGASIRVRVHVLRTGEFVERGGGAGGRTAGMAPGSAWSPAV